MASTVSVACKLPNGLFLRLFEMVEYDEPVMGGGTKTAKRAVQKGGTVRLNGNAVPFGKMVSYPIIAGYAMTTVDADFWAEWLRQNADHDAVRNRLVFANEKPDVVNGRAKEHAELQSGLQPLEPDTDKRRPRGPGNVGAVLTESRAA